MSRTRSEAEVVEIVEEIQKKLASLGRWATHLSRARSTPQVVNQMKESDGFRG